MNHLETEFEVQKKEIHLPPPPKSPRKKGTSYVLKIFYYLFSSQTLQ